MDSSLSQDNRGYTGQQTLADGAGEFNVLRFLISQALGRVATATLVQVKSVDTAASPPTVTVQILVNQVDGAGQAVPHADIYGIPYVRLQGGENAVIIDPAPGDIGLAVFASRDISSVKANKGAANPGSRRVFDYADGIYIGGVLNGTPTQFVRFTDAGIEVVSPTMVTVTAPAIELDGAVHITGAVTGDTTAVFDGNVTGAGIGLSTHKHTDVTAGAANSGGPTP